MTMFCWHWNLGAFLSIDSSSLSALFAVHDMFWSSHPLVKIIIPNVNTAICMTVFSFLQAGPGCRLHPAPFHRSGREQIISELLLQPGLLKSYGQNELPVHVLRGKGAGAPGPTLTSRLGAWPLRQHSAGIEHRSVALFQHLKITIIKQISGKNDTSLK